MKHLGEQTQVTPANQAINMNYLASNALSNMFKNKIGPNSSSSMLIPPADIILTRDGYSLLKNITFTHPYSIIATKSASNLIEMVGDGSKLFILLLNEIFKHGFLNKEKIHEVCQELRQACEFAINVINETSIQVDRNILEKLAYDLLITKTNKNFAKKLSLDLCKALEYIKNDNFDTNMIEIMRMPEGDSEDTVLINGLVLDHGNRHPLMPTELNDCLVLICNISLEYEKPEINAQFVYNTSEKRDELLQSEHALIFERASAIAKFAIELKKQTNKNLIVINEKGIDPISLEVLANAKVPALRRAKRRNLERLITMCGGNVVSDVSQLDHNNLGYCGKFRIVSFGDDKFTFIEETPNKGSCTLLIRGGSSYEKYDFIKNIIKTLSVTMKDGFVTQGGKILFLNLYDKLKSDKIGFKVLRKSIKNIMKLLDENDKVYDSCIVIKSIFNNAVILGINLLMVDDIIKAGKAIKEENDKMQQQ